MPALPEVYAKLAAECRRATAERQRARELVDRATAVVQVCREQRSAREGFALGEPAPTADQHEVAPNMNSASLES
jgi:hypothetical protein